MIRNYQKNGGIDINLTPIYQSINGLKNNIENLESLTTLTDLSVDISNLSYSVLNLNSSLSDLNDSFTTLSSGVIGELFPSVSLNSLNIDALSSSLLSVNSSLSDITNSLSTLTGGVLLTNSTFDYQAFDTTFNLAPNMFLTGNFDLNHTPSLNGSYGIWNLSHLEKKMISWLTLSNFSQITFDDIATLYWNNFMSVDKFKINCCSNLQYQYLASVYDLNFVNAGFIFYDTINTCTNLKFDSCRSIQTCQLTNISNLDIDCGRYIKSNTFSNITNMYVKNAKTFENNTITVSHGNFENCYINSCYITATNANFNNCSFTSCGINPGFAQFENCFISKCAIDEGKQKEFKNVSFSNEISFFSSANLSFNNIDFSTTNFKFLMYRGKFRIYIHNCLINGSTSQGQAFQNIFSNADSATFEFAMS